MICPHCGHAINAQSGNDKIDDYSYSIIISYLNNKIGTNYKYTTRKTQSLIRARLEDGFTPDDFKKVIDTKVTEWIGTEYEKFLRPETLFGTKFEGYLNQRSYDRKSELINDLVGDEKEKG